jgi:hypothetical protein
MTLFALIVKPSPFHCESGAAVPNSGRAFRFERPHGVKAVGTHVEGRSGKIANGAPKLAVVVAIGLRNRGGFGVKRLALLL